MAAVYTTVVRWLGGRRGHICMGNGPELDFTAPPDAHGEEGILIPEDAFRRRQYPRPHDVHVER